MNKKLKGQAAIISVLFFLSISVMVGTGFVSLGLRQTDSSETFVESLQSYVAAESGAEDALLRLKNGWDAPASYTLSVGGATADVEIQNVVEGTYSISVEGDSDERIRKIQTVYELLEGEPGFHYGAQVGEGGLEMEGNTRVYGNVYSAGPIEIGGSSQITETVIISGDDNYISGGAVGGDLYVDTCDNTDVGGDLHAYDESGCSYDNLTTEGLPVSPVELPISDTKIQEWKDEAAAGGTIGSYSLSTDNTDTLGPVKIVGNLLLEGDSRLTITGNIWVTGNITLENSSRILLDPSYGNTSEIIVADGIIRLLNNTRSLGSGSAGSYLMYISTSHAKPAISIENSARADILYTTEGWVFIENNTRLRTVVGYGIHLQNSSTLTYEIGLQDPIFSSGPQAGWTINSWREVP